MTKTDLEKSSVWEDIGNKIPLSFAEAVAAKGLRRTAAEEHTTDHVRAPSTPEVSLKEYETERIGLAVSGEIYEDALCLFTYDKRSGDEATARILYTMKIKDSVEITPHQADILVEKSEDLLSQHQQAA
jgi:hypothetical protein